MRMMLAALMSFVVPAVVSPAIAASQSYSTSVTIPGAATARPAPIEVVNGHMLFRAKLMGRDVWMLIDNRAMPSVVDLDFARSAGVKVNTLEGAVPTAHATVPKRVALNLELTIPGVAEIRSEGMLAADLGQMSKAAGRRIDGVMGYDVLNQVLLLVNWGNRTFRLGTPAQAVIPPAIPRIPLVDARPKVKILVGQTELLVTLDLGNSGALSISPDVWRRVAPKGAKLTRTTSMGLDGQPFIIEAGRLPVVTLGRFTRSDVQVAINPRSDPADGDGLIGYGFLAECDFVLDIRSGGLWLIPHLRTAQDRSS